MFYGIVIYMFSFDDRRHHLPHIHAHCAEDSAVISVDDGEILDGVLPPKKLRLVQAWIEIHKDDLMADWKLAIEGHELFKIEPLRLIMIKVTFVKAEKSYRLFVRLSNGKSGYFDVSPYLEKGVFKQLRDHDYFEQVRTAFGGVAWPNQQDFSADTIEYEMQPIEEEVA